MLMLGEWVLMLGLVGGWRLDDVGGGGEGVDVGWDVVMMGVEGCWLVS